MNAAMVLVPALFVLFLLIAAAIVIFKPQQQVVPPQERVVIYRRGLFHRIAGPGPVWFLSRIDTDEGHYNTSNLPRNIWVNNVLVHGIEANLTVNLWMRTDLLAAAGGNPSRLAELALLKEGARNAQVTVEIRGALNEALATLTAAKRLPANPTLLDKLAVLRPGTPPGKELLAYLARELPARLEALGVILDSTKRISIVEAVLPEDVVQVLKRGRLLDSLDQHLPDLPVDMRAQVAASFEGKQPLHIQELVIKGQGGTAGVVHQSVPLQDGSLVDLDLGRLTPADDAPAPRTPAASPEPAAPTQQLSKQDLQVLKRVSRDARENRKAV